MTYLIEAMVQHAQEGPYVKIAFLDERNDVSLHMEQIGRDVYRVLSVKSCPADEATLEEFMYDQQGNMNIVDEAPVITGGTNDQEGLSDNS